MLLALGCLLLAGCGVSKVPTVPVSGVVMLDGQPVANVVVTFQPVAGAPNDDHLRPGSYGTTDSDGSYELRTDDKSGAVVGEHIVTLVYKDPNQPQGYDAGSGKELPREFKLPANARDGSLRFSVPEEGTDNADFAFNSHPKPR